MTATTDTDLRAPAPRVLRDIPLGAEGRRGRLLMVSPDGAGRFRFVFYRGTNDRARQAVAGEPLEGLRDLHDRRQDVERRSSVSADLRDAIARALDLPLGDREPARIAGYLEAFPA